MTPWWAKPSRRLPILLAILAGVALYGVPRIVHKAAGAPPPCMTQLQKEPTSPRLDQRFGIWDAFAMGVWARADPCDGTWHPYRTSPPPNGRRWFANGSTVEVDCARVGAVYNVAFTNGTRSVWDAWLHLRGGGWLPSIIAWQHARNGFTGLPVC
jgi:hypothetical protein